MKRFKVIETNVSEFNNLEFKCDTRIRKDVVLPFTENKFRCVMFSGIKIQLVHNDKYIIGILF